MKKKFSLHGILQIREYKEYVELQEFSKIVAKDNILLTEYNTLETAVNKALKTNTEETDFSMIRMMHEFVASCEVKKRDIQAKREQIRNSLEKAREKYARVHKEAEALRIVHKHHKEEYRKYMNKKFFEELQEKSLCQK